MSVKITGKLIGTKSTEIKHEDSGAIIKTTAPTDNGGDGSFFSPTDLCAASLGACAITIIGMYAEKNNIPIQSVRFELKKYMSITIPRRLAKIEIHFYIESTCSDEDFKRLKNAGRTCPVSHSLLKEIEVIENYHKN